MSQITNASARLERQASNLATRIDNQISDLYFSDRSLADSATFNQIARLSRLSDKAHQRANRRFMLAFGGAA